MMDKIKLLGAGGAGKAFSLLDEFKAFAFKGNLLDMAIGIVLGAAFAKLIDAVVKMIVMPIIGMLPLGKGGYESWVIPLLGGSYIPIGAFLGEILSFVITAFALFIFFKKILSVVIKKKEAEAAAPPPPTKDQELLMEIRDLLKAQAK